MALEELLAALERDGRSKVDAELESARAEAARIAAEAEARLARRREGSLASRKSALDAETAVLVAAVRHRAKVDVLTARSRMLDRVRAAARAGLVEAVRGEGYGPALARHLAEAMAVLGEAPAVVRCPPEIAPRVRALLAGRQDVSVEGDAAAEPGLRIVGADGAFEVDATLTGRLDHSWPRLAIEVLRRVEGGR